MMPELSPDELQHSSKPEKDDTMLRHTLELQLEKYTVANTTLLSPLGQPVGKRRLVQRWTVDPIAHVQ